MAAHGPEKTAEKPSGNTGLLITLGCLVLVNLVLGVMFVPRHVELHHPPVVQLPNFLTSLGVPGEWMPGHVTFTWLIMGLLVGSGALVSRSLRPVPGAFQNLVEVTIEAFYGLLDQMIGKQGRQFLPLIGTAGLFILTSNLLGNIPGFQPPTANWNTTVALAVTVFISYNYFGIRKHGLLNYLRHFCGPVLLLAPLIFPIEFIGHLARPVSLSIRLFGNMFGEESVIVILLSLSWLVMPYAIYLAIMLPLSLFTAIVQTFVFIMLSMVYIAGAVEEGHGEEHH
ncbi:MAG TPA: F0F1 ATP synthase subunit A [Candidatus Methylomirabilis sp.]|nr:F0F1 ATP synthase subunit A [Candidatus Methylomirabilis sp.]HSC71556.1 F0F1 ATP synthase subunit A [Candidatus Methylomirabilis sp.]